jgi:hypothetical protein
MSDIEWQKSSYSSGDVNQTCVELAHAPGGLVHLRESDIPGKVLTTTPTRLAALLRAITTQES